jgi:hypothetical protein
MMNINREWKNKIAVVTLALERRPPDAWPEKDCRWSWWLVASTAWKN